MLELIKRLLNHLTDGRLLTTPGGLAGGLNDANASRLPYPLVQKRMRNLLSDCGDGPTVERLRFKIEAAKTPRELWQLRSDLYSELGTTLNQAEAARRVNSLLPSFSGWLPDWQLKHIG